MKVLITGACGHIGSYIAQNIHKIKKIKEVIMIDNLKTEKYYSLFDLNTKIKFKFYKIDLSKQNIDDFKKIEYVIHCASHTNAQESFSAKKEMLRNNIGCMKNVLNFCIKNKSKLIHISSSSVYGKQVKIVYEDNDNLIKPQSPYAEIKILEEKLLKKNKSKLNFISFRFGTIAGVSKGMRFHTAINKFCLNASLNKRILVYKTALNQYRPYLSLRDAFKIFKHCIEKNKFTNQTYNALSGNFTVKQIINIIKKYKRNLKIKLINAKIMNNLSYITSNKKIRKLGIKLNSKIGYDIHQTLSLFKNLKN